MRIHILGICGTFMSGLAMLAKQAGYEVSGSDMNVYPPMSTQLKQQGINVFEGYDPANFEAGIDSFIIGNVIKRGNPAMEYILDKELSYSSGPQWLAEHVLKGRWVLAVSGTHGKTTTTSMLTFILEFAGLNPGFLVGGVPENFGVSARLGKTPYFVIEADEYDSAYFDKRPKFIHYHPKTLILNNLEYDHADIYPDLEAIKQQFHYLIRTVPGNGLIVQNAQDLNLADVIAKGCWTPLSKFDDTNADWRAKLIKQDGSAFSVLHQNKEVGMVNWDLIGRHNVANALAAIAAAHHAQVDPEQAIKALSLFKNVKRRMEVKGRIKDITVYDDFAHHPTAIATTLAGLRAKIGDKSRMIVVLEFGSYTMRAGVHRETIKHALSSADMVFCKAPEVDWGLNEILQQFQQPTGIYPNAQTLVSELVPTLRSGDHLVVMSNSGFEKIHEKLLSAIEKG